MLLPPRFSSVQRLPLKNFIYVSVICVFQSYVVCVTTSKKILYETEFCGNRIRLLFLYPFSNNYFWLLSLSGSSYGFCWHILSRVQKHELWEVFDFVLWSYSAFLRVFKMWIAAMEFPVCLYEPLILLACVPYRLSWWMFVRECL